MAKMPFLKDFRRRKSMGLGKHLESSEESKSSESNGTNKSSSTLDSIHNGTSTPASSIQPSASNGNLVNLKASKSSASIAPPPQRPVPLTSVGNRSSYLGMNTPSINGTVPPKAPLSAFAPRIVSVSENSWVHQKVLLVYGNIGDPNERPIDGTVGVCHHQDNFPATSWPVHESRFKALVHLTPGPNRLRFDFSSPKVTSTHPSLPSHCSWLTINFLPLATSPPLQLAIILGKDSPGTFDSVPERKQRDGNDLALAIRKFRMSAYLWQAFTGEQMYRQGLGRRCFRFEEQWQNGTLTNKDREMGTMRSEARVHVIRSTKTVAQLHQAARSDASSGLFDIAMEACGAHFSHQAGSPLYVSALFLDSHWDAHSQSIAGHTAMGGTADSINLGVFGSHMLQSYPASIEEVVPAFSDCTRTDTKFVANIDSTGGSNWEAANSGIGAHLYEIGRLFGCPQRDSGIMKGDYLQLSRTFLARESYCTRTKSPGLRSTLPKDECSWSRLDTLRFKYHPCFGLPTDAPLNPDGSIQVWPAENSKVILTAATGIAYIEIYAGNEDDCHSWIEYGLGDVQAGGPPRQVVLSEDEVRDRLTNKKAKHIKIKIFSAGLGLQIIDDFSQFVKSKEHVVKLPHGQSGFRGSRLGVATSTASTPQEVLIESAFVQKKLLTCIRAFHSLDRVDGLEFQYEDSTYQQFGNRCNSFDDFTFDTRRGVILLGFHLRIGTSIEGLEILTSLGRRSGIHGNSKAGSAQTLIAPRGYYIAGISGTCGTHIDSFSLIISR